MSGGLLNDAPVVHTDNTVPDHFLVVKRQGNGAHVVAFRQQEEVAKICAFEFPNGDPCMPANGFGTALKELRVRRTLSQRELGLLSEVDNAYINRLETGEKDNPTAETVTKLVRALKASERDTLIFKWLAEHPTTWPDLVSYTLISPGVPYDHFVSAAGMSFRGEVRPTPESLLARVKRMYDEEE